MKLLILTQYFPPEIGAPQNRLFELCTRLVQKDIEITVLTAMPNYPRMEVHDEYKGKFHVKEEIEGIIVHRSWIYVTKSKRVFSRLINYFSFVFSSMFSGTFRLNKFDYILCESPPLFLGISAVWLKWIKGAKLIFNVSDLWPESAEKLELVINKTFLKLATKLEEGLYKRSVLITGQTQGIVQNIKDRFPQKEIYWLPNGVDVDYYNANEITTNWRKDNGFLDKDFILLYAGVIGHAQGLEVILKSAKRLENESKIKFILLGNGPEKERLLQLQKDLEINNVFFFDSVGKHLMPAIIKASDATIVPLKKLDLFKGAIPSKIFENLALKKPVILGVDGEARKLFIDEGECGLYFEPENEIDLSEAILKLINDNQLQLKLGNNGFDYVSKYFSRDKITNDFWQYISNMNIKK